MEFTFTASVEIYGGDIDRMVKNVRKYKMDIEDAINDILAGYDDFEYYCRGYYFDDLKAEVERRLKGV